MVFIDKEQVKHNFGQGSASYDEYARVQKVMARTLLDQVIAEGKEFRDILEIGCGTGFLTEGLAQAFPHSRIVAVDISSEMVNVAKRKLTNYKNITYLVEDAENLKVNTSFDLIVSSAVFQWFDDYLKPFNIYYNLLKENGMFIFNTFGGKTFCELSQALRSLGKSVGPRSFINSDELGKTLLACGFKNLRLNEEIYKDYYHSARKLLLGIKKIGANSYSGDTRFHGGDIFKLARYFDSNFRDENGVYLSYQVLYVHAQKNNMS